MPETYQAGTYTHRIEYNAQGGTSVERTANSKSSNASSVSVSTNVSTSTPTKSGYTFESWNTKADGTGTSYASGASVSHTFSRSVTFVRYDIINGITYEVYKANDQSYTTTLYARYALAKYSVNYAPGTYANESAGIHREKTHGQPLTLLGASFTYKDDPSYTQTGWSENPNGTVKAYDLGGSYTVDAPITLYPYWTQDTYTVTYNKGANGTGSNLTVVKQHGVELRLSDARFTRTGYTQTGWATSDGGAQAYALGATYSTNADLTLYPVWTINQYTVNFNGNGGTSLSGLTRNYNTSITLPSTTWKHTVKYRANYTGGTNPTDAAATYRTFAGWYTAASGGSKVGNAGASYTVTADVTLYAHWSGSASSVTLPTLTRAGYTLNGWFTAASGGTKVGNAGATYMPTANVTLYAQWSLTEYTVSYHPNGGSGEPDSQTKTHGVALTLSSTAPTRTGYSFLGWSTSSTATSATYCTGPSHTTNNSYTTNANATLYAVWSILTYTVSYNKGSNGTGTNSTATKTYNVDLTLKGAQFTRTGFSQTGWATSDGGAQVYALGGTYQANASVTLYPVWTATNATLSSVTSSVDCGGSLTASWTSTSSSYKYKLKVTCGNAAAAWSTLTAANASTASVTIPTSWYTMANGPMRDSETAVATCTLYTYASNGTTQIGSASSMTFEVKVPSNVKPTLGSVTASSASDNTAVSGWGNTVFVQGYSMVSIAASVSSYNGSRFSKVRYYGQGLDSVITGTLTSSSYSSVIYSTKTLRYYAEVTDTRGRSNTGYVDVTFQPYSHPVVSKITVLRCNSDLTTNNATGEYFKATPTFSFSPVTVNGTDKNELLTHTIQYRVHPNGAWTTATNCASGTTYGPWSSSFTNAYDVKVTLVDRIQNSAGQSTTFTTTLPSIQGIWYGRGNDRLGLGGVPPSAGLHVDWDAKFNGVLDVTKRRCQAVVTTENSGDWYRILQFTAPNAQMANGHITTRLDIVVGDTINDLRAISVVMQNDTVDFFDDISSSSGSGYISKIRYAVDGAVGYVDVFITSPSARTMWAYVDPLTIPEYQSRFTTMDFVKVTDSPTVLATHEFSTSPILDISSEFAFNTTDISILSSSVIAYFDARTRRVSIDYNMRASAIFNTSTAFLTCNNSDYYIGVQTDFPAMVYNNNGGVWETYLVRATTSGDFTQRLTVNATKVYGHIEYYV